MFSANLYFSIYLPVLCTLVPVFQFIVYEKDDDDDDEDNDDGNGGDMMMTIMIMLKIMMTTTMMMRRRRARGYVFYYILYISQFSQNALHAIMRLNSSITLI